MTKAQNRFKGFEHWERTEIAQALFDVYKERVSSLSDLDDEELDVALKILALAQEANDFTPET
jgi:hypothetical protein